MSRRDKAPIEDSESFRCSRKKSVSSYAACSGELAEEDAEVDSLSSSGGSCGLDVGGIACVASGDSIVGSTFGLRWSPGESGRQDV